MNLEHKKRWITALVGVPALFAAYYFFRHWALVVLTIAISVAAYGEFLTFSGAAQRLRWPAMVTALALSAWLSLQLPGALIAMYVAALLILLRSLWQVHKAAPEEVRVSFFHAQSRIFGLFYLVVFPSFLPKIHSLAHGPALLLFLLLIIWVGDTAAYYGGKLLGRHKLSLNVSPGKTMEGALTALVACVLLALLFWHYALPHLLPWKLALLAVAASLVAQAGDLLESLMKRAYQVKDSGNLIPGHGGVFDRFDSLILAAPFFYFLVRIGT